MENPRGAPSLGKLELRIMQVLWQSGPVTARQITDAINEGVTRPVAHSTIQTLLRKMEAKGAVTHESEDRIFVFRAAVAENDATRSAAKDLLGRVFGGSVYGLVSHLLRHETISPEERERLRHLIDSTPDTAEDSQS
jgi:BlaI family transcriptional regulator, penicillinase repressor